MACEQTRATACTRTRPPAYGPREGLLRCASICVMTSSRAKGDRASSRAFFFFSHHTSPVRQLRVLRSDIRIRFVAPAGTERPLERVVFEGGRSPKFSWSDRAEFHEGRRGPWFHRFRRFFSLEEPRFRCSRAAAPARRRRPGERGDRFPGDCHEEKSSGGTSKR